MSVILHGFEYRKRCRNCPLKVHKNYPTLVQTMTFDVWFDYWECLVTGKPIDIETQKHNKDCPMERYYGEEIE